MNTGIQDACNLAWKLALVLRGSARGAVDAPAARLELAARVIPSDMPARPRPRPSSLPRSRAGRRAAGESGSDRTIGLPVVAALAQADVERDLAEQRHVVRRSGCPGRRRPGGHRRSRTPRPCSGAQCGQGRQDMFSIDADDSLVHLRGDRAGPLGHLGGGLLGRGHDEDLGVRDSCAPPRSRRRRCRAAGRAGARRGRPSRRRRGTAAGPGAASGRATTTGALPGLNMPIEMTDTPWAGGGMIMSSTWVGRCRSTPSMRGHRVAVDVGVDDADPQALRRPARPRG